MPSMKRHRRIRLDVPLYGDEGRIVSITIAAAGRNRVFTDERVAHAATGVLRGPATALEVPIYAYCVMPDHVHLVLSPAPACDAIAFVARFKSLTLRSVWELGIKGSFWQRGFWDRILRKDEDLRTAVDYVLNNPVRQGLVASWRDYPFCGSLELDL